jgi:hypothetical protein
MYGPGDNIPGAVTRTGLGRVARSPGADGRAAVADHTGRSAMGDGWHDKRQQRSGATMPTPINSSARRVIRPIDAPFVPDRCREHVELGDALEDRAVALRCGSAEDALEQLGAEPHATGIDADALQLGLEAGRVLLGQVRQAQTGPGGPHADAIAVAASLPGTGRSLAMPSLTAVRLRDGAYAPCDRQVTTTPDLALQACSQVLQCGARAATISATNVLAAMACRSAVSPTALSRVAR